LVYADDVTIFGGSVHSITKNTEAVVVARKEIRLDILLIKLSIWSCLEIRMKDEVIT